MKHSTRCCCHVCHPEYRGYPQSEADKKHPWAEGAILKFISTFLEGSNRHWQVEAEAYFNGVFMNKTDISGIDWNLLEDVDNEQ